MTIASPYFLRVGNLFNILRGMSTIGIMANAGGIIRLPRRLPRALGDLGLPASELERHIAYDIGIWPVAQQLAAIFDVQQVHHIVDIGQGPPVEYLGRHRSVDRPPADSRLRDDPPPVSELRPELPNHLGRIVRRCLEKDSRRRLHDVADVRIEIEDLLALGPETGDPRHFATFDELMEAWKTQTDYQLQAGIDYIGLPWLTRRGSGIVYGINADAESIGERIEGRVRSAT